MDVIDVALEVLRVRTVRLLFLFGRVKGFPAVEQLAIAEGDVPVHVAGDTDVHSALA